MWNDDRIAARAWIWCLILLGGARIADAQPGEPAATAAASTAFRCQAAETSGPTPEDAVTAVEIVCGELASASGSSGSFLVSLRPLGSTLVLTVSREGTAEGRSLILQDLAEVPIAARRLAEAMVTGKSLEETRRVDNLLESEDRKEPRLSGSKKREIGAMAFVAASGQGTGMGAGFSTAIGYDSAAFSVQSELRWAHSSDERASLFSIDAGSRYYFSRRNVSPFAGGGFSVLHLSHSNRERWGPGLFAEGGVQFFRLYRGRLGAKLRADLPFFTLQRHSRRGEGGTTYLVPLTFGVTIGY